MSRVKFPSPGFEAQLSGDELVRPSLAGLVRLSQPAAGLNLARSTVRALQSGQYLTAFKGRGMEFDETRLYSPGDDARNLDWRVTARTGRPHTKLFREERERPVYLGVDFRAPMFFATRGMFKSVMAARLAALIAWSARRHGDRIGGQIFSESGSLDLKPEHGHRAVLRFLKALVDRSLPMTAGNGARMFEDALVRLPRHARPGSLVFLFSDFRDLTPAGESALTRLARHCDPVLVFIYDPLEQRLPGGRHRFANGLRELVLDADTATAAVHAQHFQVRLDRVRRLAATHGMRFSLCSTVDDPLIVLQQSRRPSVHA